MFIKEVVKYFMSRNLSIYLRNYNIPLINNECEDITQKYTNISRAVRLECIVVIIKMIVEKMGCSWDFLVQINHNLIILFYYVTHLSTDIKWLISPLKNIMDSIDKEYDRAESNQ